MRIRTALDAIAPFILTALLAAVPAVAGTRSQAGASVTPVPVGLCGPGVYQIHEIGSGVDDVQGAFSLDYLVCLQPQSVDAYGRPTSWYASGGTGTLTFYGPTTPGNPLPVRGTLQVELVDHLQVVDPVTGIGTPEDGVALAKVVGGTGEFQGARGQIRGSYASPQAAFGFVSQPIALWWSLVLN